MLEHKIRTFQEKDRTEVLELYRTFAPIVDGLEYGRSLKYFEKALISSRVIVAESESKVIELASYMFASEDQEMKKDHINCLYYGRKLKEGDEESKKILEDFYQENKLDFGGDFVMECYDNEFTQNEIEIKDSDTFFNNIIVLEKFRQNGIGTELIKKRIQIAKENDSSAIYADCWEGGNVSRLYDKLGFIPIIKGGPFYADGNAVKVMGLLISHEQ